MNVMLTRCRRGMVIVSGRSFLQGVASRTLLGKLCAYWTTQEGPKTWVDAGDVLNTRVDLPGAAGKSSNDVTRGMSKLNLAH
ncbi:hypothetical protein GYMLUDRAFT_233460 [Collybiopsis luxurians FD-317 M1]|uniref:DNA2/NAM7 helicase-like C-terminal domain-containing protein n=1 Tax=Collybiopsis luxurians FD-317 M1 TaxID=944289 RepID=A0A0D0AQ43_9AGAR|nr:hypothetical protein GYMLUDRAFT_233460 [Collybiopsis luxurians FD-317 M1]